jgi:hypothetical protein
MTSGHSLLGADVLGDILALVPSDTACLAGSPGSRSLTAVWISMEVMVDLLDVGDEGVRDAHGLGGDAGAAVHLLQDLVV